MIHQGRILPLTGTGKADPCGAIIAPGWGKSAFAMFERMLAMADILAAIPPVMVGIVGLTT